MRKRLPRQMIWKAKTTLEEFTEEPLGSQLYDLYNDLQRSDYSHYSLNTSIVKLLNEAYYQSTRIIYEKKPYITVRDIMIDIKSNVTEKHDSEVVLLMVRYILLLQEDQSIEIRRLLEIMNNVPMPSFSIDVDRIREIIGGQNIRLRPNPCCPEVIENMLIDWPGITENFSENVVRSILNLWSDPQDKMKVIFIIERAFRQYVASTEINHSEDIIKEWFFSYCRELLSPVLYNKVEQERNDAEKVKHLEKRLEKAEKQIKELRFENEQLKSELNMEKSKGIRARAFTLTLIVEYCKNKFNFKQVEAIIAMLYKFLRQNGTDEEYAMVDSIEEEFNARKAAPHVEHQTVERQIVIPPKGHYHEHTGTINNNFPSLPQAMGQNPRIIE